MTPESKAFDVYYRYKGSREVTKAYISGLISFFKERGDWLTERFWQEVLLELDKKLYYSSGNT